MSNAAPLIIWCISAATIAAILLRPGRVGEWVWACAGAAVLVAAGLLPPNAAARAAADGLEVYLFLGGMLALAELGRIHGVFDWLSGVMLSGNAHMRAGTVLAWVYAVGAMVTAVLSNDGTILLLTPAAFAIAARARIDPLPMLFACAFVANAASFLLPVSNPANLVLFPHLPSLTAWLHDFGFASLASIGATFVLLRVAMRARLRGRVAEGAGAPRLSRTGKAALAAISVSAGVVVLAAALQRPVGGTAAIFGVASTLAVTVFDRATLARIVREASWSIGPLVAGLFVIVRALDRTGVLQYTRAFFAYAGSLHWSTAGLLAGGAVAIGDNVFNNLPVGVFARYSLQSPAEAPHVVHAALVGLDLGPNLSASGSLATLLWIMLLRRENVIVTPLQFLRIGALVTIPPLVLALLAVR